MSMSASEILSCMLGKQSRWWSSSPQHIVSWCGYTRLADIVSNLELRYPEIFEQCVLVKKVSPVDDSARTERAKRVLANIAHDILSSSASRMNASHIVRGSANVDTMQQNDSIDSTTDRLAEALGALFGIVAVARKISDISLGIGALCAPFTSHLALHAVRILPVTDSLRSEIAPHIPIDLSGLGFASCSLFEETMFPTQSEIRPDAKDAAVRAHAAKNALPERLRVCEYASALESLYSESDVIRAAAMDASRGIVAHSAENTLWIPELPNPPPITLEQGTMTYKEAVMYDPQHKTFPRRTFGQECVPALPPIVFGVPCCCRYSKLREVSECSVCSISARCSVRGTLTEDATNVFSAALPQSPSAIYALKANVTNDNRAWTCTSPNVVCRSTMVSVLSPRAIMALVRAQLIGACSAIADKVCRHPVDNISTVELAKMAASCSATARSLEWQLPDDCAIVTRESITMPHWEPRDSGSPHVSNIRDICDIYVTSAAGSGRDVVVSSAAQSHGGHCRLVPAYSCLAASIVCAIVRKILQERDVDVENQMPTFAIMDIADTLANVTADAAYVSDCADVLRKQWLARTTRSRGLARGIISRCCQTAGTDVPVVTWATPHVNVALPFYYTTVQNCSSAGILRQRTDSTNDDVHRSICSIERMRAAPASHAPIDVYRYLFKEGTAPHTRVCSDPQMWPLWLRYMNNDQLLLPLEIKPPPAEFVVPPPEIDPFAGCAGMIMQGAYDKRIENTARNTVHIDISSDPVLESSSSVIGNRTRSDAWEASARAFAAYDVVDGSSWPYRKDLQSQRIAFRCGSPRVEAACGLGLDGCTAGIMPSAALPCSCVVRLACAVAHACDTHIDARIIDRTLAMDTVAAIATNTLTTEAALCTIIAVATNRNAGRPSGPVEACVDSRNRGVLEDAVSSVLSEMATISHERFKARRPFSQNLRSAIVPNESGEYAVHETHISDVEQLSAGIVSAYAAARRCKSVIAQRANAGRFSQAWHIVNCMRCNISEAVCACSAMGAHTAAQEVATYVASWDSSPCVVPCADSAAKSVAFVRGSDGAAYCDIVWGIALAASALGGSPEDLARAARIGGESAATAIALGGSRFGGRTCEHSERQRGEHTMLHESDIAAANESSDEDESVPPVPETDTSGKCGCLGDDRDAYAFGALSAMLADGMPSRCIAVYPFVSTVLLCTRQDPKDEDHVTTVRRIAACPWSTLLLSASIWLADALESLAHQHSVGLDGFRTGIGSPYRVPPPGHMTDKLSKNAIRAGLGDILACCAYYLSKRPAQRDNVLRGICALLRSNLSLQIIAPPHDSASRLDLDWLIDLSNKTASGVIYTPLVEENVMRMWNTLYDASKVAIASLSWSLDENIDFEQMAEDVSCIVSIVSVQTTVSVVRKVPEASAFPVVPGALCTDAVRSKHERAATAFARAAAIQSCKVDDRAWIDIPGHAGVAPLKSLAISLHALWNKSRLDTVFNATLSLLADAEDALWTTAPVGWFESDRQNASVKTNIRDMMHVPLDPVVAIRRCDSKLLALSQSFLVADYPYSSPDACPYECECGGLTWSRPPSAPVSLPKDAEMDMYDRTNRAWWEAYMLPKCSPLLGLIVSFRHGIPVIAVSLEETSNQSANLPRACTRPFQISTASDLVSTSLTLASFMASVQ